MSEPNDMPHTAPYCCAEHTSYADVPTPDDVDRAFSQRLADALVDAMCNADPEWDRARAREVRSHMRTALATLGVTGHPMSAEGVEATGGEGVTLTEAEREVLANVEFNTWAGMGERYGIEWADHLLPAITVIAAARVQQAEADMRAKWAADVANVQDVARMQREDAQHVRAERDALRERVEALAEWYDLAEQVHLSRSGVVQDIRAALDGTG